MIIIEGYVSNKDDSEEWLLMSLEERQRTIDPVKHGRWIPGREISKTYIGDCCVGIDYEDWRCSECGDIYQQPDKPKWKHCPNCGARMEGEEK